MKATNPQTACDSLRLPELDLSTDDGAARDPSTKMQLPDKSPAALKVYVDESGNAGDAAVTANKSFDDQRAFVLVGVGEVSGSGSIVRVLDDVRTKHKLKSEEFKTRAMKRSPEVVYDLIERLFPGHPLFAEIMDKKFYLAANLVSYVLRGRDFHPLEHSQLANAYADLLTDLVDDRAFIAFGEFAQRRDVASFTAFVENLKCALVRAKLGMRGDQETEFQLLSQMEKRLGQSVRERGNDLDSFLPPQDVASRGKTLPMLPHVPAFVNLLARVNGHIGSDQSAQIIHDEQKQFDSTLRSCVPLIERFAEDLANLSAVYPASSNVNWRLDERIQIEFADSKTERAIQAADMIARFCMQRMVALLTDQVPGDHRRVLRTLFDHQDSRRGVGLNIVASTQMVAKFWAPVIDTDNESRPSRALG